MVDQLIAAFIIGLSATAGNAPTAHTPSGACSVGFPVYVRQLPPVVSNELVISAAGTWHWNGSIVTAGDVASFLKLIDQMDPRPQMTLAWQTGADCTEVDRAETVIAESGYCRDEICFSAGIVDKIPEPPRSPPPPPLRKSNPHAD
jgi:hypothetical protein